MNIINADQLDVQMYPIAAAEDCHLNEFEKPLETWQDCGAQLYTLFQNNNHAIDLKNSGKIIDSLYATTSVIRELQNYVLNGLPSNRENIALYFTTDSEQIMHSLSHGYWDNNTNTIHFSHLLNAPWNLTDKYSYSEPMPNIPGAGLRLLKSSIIHLRAQYPNSPVTIRVTQGSKPLFEKMGFEPSNMGFQQKFPLMKLSPMKVAQITKKLL